MRVEVLHVKQLARGMPWARRIGAALVEAATNRIRAGRFGDCAQSTPSDAHGRKIPLGCPGGVWRCPRFEPDKRFRQDEEGENMKVLLVSALVAAGMLSAGAALASADLANKDGCMKCHDIDKKKKGPSFQDAAKKYKGKADAEAAMFKSITDPKGDHPEVKASPDDVKSIVKWVLTL
jgi:cytochrome c